MFARPAAATRRPHPVLPVLYVLRDDAGGWTVRRAGAAEEDRFPDRTTAAAYARTLGAAAGAYRLFLERADGRLVCEMLNLRAAG